MHENMIRVESAVSATASGDLTWEHWTHDCATALGLSGAKNPLGFAVVRYLSDGPSMGSIMGLAMHLAAALTNRGHDGKAAYGNALSAIDAWNNLRCPSCMGRGVTDFEQTLCKICGGSGEKDLASIGDVIRDGIGALMEAERWIEGQLAARLRGTSYEQRKDGCSVNLPMNDSQADHGFNHRAATAPRKSHE